MTGTVLYKGKTRVAGMIRLCALSLCAGLTLTGTAVMACTPPPIEDRSAAELRRLSKPAAMDRSCRMINGGIDDYKRLGPVKFLGADRWVQRVNGEDSFVYLVECSTKHITLLQGPVVKIDEYAPCGPYYHRGALIGPDAVMSLKDGKDLRELVEIATKRGAVKLNPVSYFFEFERFGHPGTNKVSGKDRFDLLCACGDG